VLVEPVSPFPDEMKPIPGNQTSHVLLTALNVTSSPQLSGVGESVSAKPNGVKRLHYRSLQTPWKNLPHTHW
jgi:hypothetical protein